MNKALKRKHGSIVSILQPGKKAERKHCSKQRQWVKFTPVKCLPGPGHTQSVKSSVNSWHSRFIWRSCQLQRHTLPVVLINTARLSHPSWTGFVHSVHLLCPPLVNIVNVSLWVSTLKDTLIFLFFHVACVSYTPQTCCAHSINLLRPLLRRKWSLNMINVWPWVSTLKDTFF